MGTKKISITAYKGQRHGRLDAKRGGSAGAIEGFSTDWLVKPYEGRGRMGMLYRAGMQYIKMASEPDITPE